MAQAGVTDQSVLEAGIAAHLSVAPNLLPPEISELSDQAALFASNNTNAFMFTGSADADSENTNFGDSLSTKAIEKVIKLEERRRKEDDPAGDAGMIAELAASQRERLAAMQNVTVGGVTLTREEWDEVAKALQTDEGVSAARDALMAEGKTSDQANEIIRLTQLLASAAQKQQDGIPLTPEEEAAVARVENDPELQADVKTTTDAALNTVSQSELTPTQNANRDIATIEDGEVFSAARAEMLDEESLVGENIAARDGQSIASSVSPESMFDMAAYSPSEEFNLQGLDTVRLAAAEPVQLEPAQTQSEPGLGIRA